ncbi:Hint domain-containing protein [Paracoccus alkanivorans]|uniref:Hemolysin n=1 Tax=Paracoccus alkanivorans TaxID=2116655 RepID=A0A3M0MIT4_9RHOB|nr:Hint domain-containing protein [Paracoccus alkanivorans]RMC37509.1 hemolysin [Paracoccus alkanivorans]
MTIYAYKTYVVDGVVQSTSELVPISGVDADGDNQITQEEWAAYLEASNGHTQGSGSDGLLYDGAGDGNTGEGYLYSSTAYEQGDDISDVMAALQQNYPPVSLESIGVVCFVRGTVIETREGPVPVENLQVGTSVLTKDNGYQSIRWIGTRRLFVGDLMNDPRLKPIRIRAGALGDNKPSTDLLVSPQHRVLVRSRIAQQMFGTLEVLVAAKQLLCLEGVDILDDVEEVEYIHFLFDRHEIVCSNGAETESLYTGPEALKTVGKAALEEIFDIFPQLRDRNPADLPAAVRPLVSGRMGRELAARHVRNNCAMIGA